jgi:hypothetical protein
MSVKVTKDNVQDMLRAINQLAKKDVLVGIPDSVPERDDQNPKPISNAVIGYIQENGSAVNGIPPRPFLIPGIADAQDKIAETLGKGATAALSGSATQAEASLHRAGLIGQNSARAKINTGPFQALASSTLAARRRRGRTGTKPLIDTGQLRNSITYVIRNK